MAHDDTIHRCINAACGRAFARRVNFCPWCGTAQRAGAMHPAPVPPVLAKAAPSHAHESVAPAQVAAPPQPVPPAAPAPSAPPPSPSPAPTPAPTPPRSSASSTATAHRSVPPVPPVPKRSPVRPDGRKPIRLRWWLLALGALWLAWVLTKPTEARIERRMKAAIALAQECKPREAQDELIALRKTRATPEQLRRVQDGLNAAAAACTRAERRRNAWEEASAALEKLLRDGSIDRARARLAAFTKRWGEDAQTRELRRRIDAERHPLADPSRAQ